MKLTKTKLKQIIKEELQKVISEDMPATFSRSEVAAAIKNSLKDILGAAGVKKAGKGGLSSKYSYNDPYRKDYRSIYKLGKELRSGADVMSIVNKLNKIPGGADVQYHLGIAAPKGKQAPAQIAQTKPGEAPGSGKVVARAKAPKFSDEEKRAASAQMAKLRKAPGTSQVAKPPKINPAR